MRFILSPGRMTIYCCVSNITIFNFVQAGLHRNTLLSPGKNVFDVKCGKMKGWIGLDMLDSSIMNLFSFSRY